MPRHGNAGTRAFGRLALRVSRWHLAGAIPDVPRAVAIAAPHTSTLDVFVAGMFLLALGIRVRWLGKHTIFRWPLASLLRWFGGIPVDRRAPGGFVEHAAAMMRNSDRLFLGLAPEGTRKKVAHWKTGFYRVALASAVPIVPVALDYRRRVVDVGPPLEPTGDYEADLARLRTHFSADMARHPERY